MICYPNRIQVLPEKRITILGMDEDDSYICRGEVVAVGKNVKFASVGDILLFSPYAVEEVEVDDGEKLYFIIDNDLILAKYEMKKAYVSSKSVQKRVVAPLGNHRIKPKVV